MSKSKLAAQGVNDSRVPLARHFTEDIPDVVVDEVSAGLRQLKNGRDPGDDGITTELLKSGGANPCFQF